MERAQEPAAQIDQQAADSSGQRINYVEPLHQDGTTVYASVCRLGLEGIVSKRIDAPYRGGRSD